VELGDPALAEREVLVDRGARESPQEQVLQALPDLGREAVRAGA
jgi:hypothetical protein